MLKSTKFPIYLGKFVWVTVGVGATGVWLCADRLVVG